jgi:alkanesulfonate monooxygenase SsuD/methylene tetrahydromethanopterin reductase-like flavin-dependent oxidoreductase (luciferase family)
MQFAIDLPPFGPFGDPNLVAELAREAEEAGWHGFFLWDHINYKLEDSPETLALADPWMLLAAIALRTTSIRLGTMVTEWRRVDMERRAGALHSDLQRAREDANGAP